MVAWQMILMLTKYAPWWFDAYGNKLSGVQVNFTVGNNAKITETTLSDKQGGVTAAITSTKAGTYTVTAELNG